MNSDKLDKFLKEQINSLDRVPLPDSNWNREKSWNKISNTKTGNRKITLWWYASGVAAVILLMITLWFAELNTENINTDLAKVNLNKNVDILPIEKETGSVKKMDNEQTIHNESVEVLPDSDAHPPKTIVSIESEPLNYLKQNYQIATLDFVQNTPELINSYIKSKPQKIRRFAVNRTYNIKKNNKINNKFSPTNNEIKLQINLALNSSSDPPSGFLPGIIK